MKRLCVLVLVALLYAVEANCEESPPTEEPVNSLKNTAAIESSLAKPISFEFREKPFSEVLTEIASKLDINVVLDEKSLDDTNTMLESAITFRVRDITAESALTLLLEPMELDFAVRDEVLWISTEEAVSAIMNARVYDVSHWVGDDETIDAVIELITNTVARDTWDEVGGSGAISPVFIDGNHHLVISQTRRVHRKIAALFADLRAKKPLFGKADSKGSSISQEQAESQLGEIALNRAIGNDFAVDLYREARMGRTDSLILSPFGVFSSLGLFYPGADGETAKEIAEVLGLPDESAAAVAATAGNLKQILQDSGGKVELLVANRLWGDQRVQFRPEFLKLAGISLEAPPSIVDFSNKSQVCDTINGWVRERTRDRIKEVILPDQFDPMTALMVTNAIHFKGRWDVPLPNDASLSMPFFAAEEKVDIPAMAHRHKYAYGKFGGVQVLEMPYSGKKFSMVILLPPKGAESLAALENELSSIQIEGWMRLLKNREVDLKMPKFSLASHFRLVETLKRLGINKAFDAGKNGADFSRLVEDTPSGMPIYVSEVLHRADVSVDESGTVAAAATATIGAFGSFMPQSIEFHADHPFMFFIRHRNTGAILFIGRFVGK